MLIVKKTNAHLGILLMLIGSFCPIIKVKIIVNLVNWNLYKTDARLAYITYALLALTLIFLFARQLKAFKFFTVLNFIWVVVMALAVWFKSSHYLGRAWADNLLGKSIHFQWGWIVLALGAFILITSTKKMEVNLQA